MPVVAHALPEVCWGGGVPHPMTLSRGCGGGVGGGCWGIIGCLSGSAVPPGCTAVPHYVREQGTGVPSGTGREQVVCALTWGFGFSGNRWEQV